MPIDNFAESAEPRLLDQVRIAIRTRHYSTATEAAYVAWVKRFVIFHGKRHPNLLAEADVAQYLNHLASDRRVSPSTQNQALAVLLFLYRQVLGREIGWIEGVVRARYRMRSPFILSCDEVRSIIAELNGVRRLVVTLLYGSGMRIGECLKLRVKDIDFAVSRSHIANGKGAKDRITILPQCATPLLQLQLDRVRRLFEADIARGYGQVYVPTESEHRFAHAANEWRWQFVLPRFRLTPDAHTGRLRRHCIEDQMVQRGIREVAPCRDRQTSHLPQLPSCLRHPPIGVRRRYPHGAGTAR